MNNSRHWYSIFKKAACFALVLLGSKVLADPLVVSDLSGTWSFTPQGANPTTIQVPGGGWYKQGFTTITEANYQKTVVIPDSGQAQVTKIEFGAVNYQADLYIDETYVGTNLTAFTPSSFDITNYVTPGQSCTIRVHVKGRRAFMVNNKSTMPNAAGWSANTPQGIFRSAQIKVYPQTNISDVFVRPSVSNACLYYDVWVTNASPNLKSLVLSGRLTSWNGDPWAYPSITDQTISLASGSTSKITIGPVPWNLGPSSYWWPNVPYQKGYAARLHHLNLAIAEKGNPCDSTVIRFGFRDLVQKSDGTNTCYFLNGIRVNFRGDSLQGADYDSINDGGGYGDAFDTLPGFLPGPNGWAQAVDNYQRLNYNFVRLHQEPVTPYMIDVCDEMGLMLMEETAIRGSNKDQDFVTGHDNMVNHLKALFSRDRNHPSIVRQSLSNEPNLSDTDSNAFEIDLYNAAMSVDGTRPLSIDAGGSASYSALSYPNFSVFGHYGNGLGNYTETVWARTNQPYGQGEFVWNRDNTPQGFCWFSTGAQAMRRQGASDIRPYTLLSAWAGFVPGAKRKAMTLEQGGNPLYGEDNLVDPWSNPQIIRVQAGFNPVLVADRDYWAINKLSNNQGDWPATIPSVNPNQSMNRILDVYNDTFSGTAVDVYWELHQDSPSGLLVKSGALHPNIPLGYFASLPISFTIPKAEDGTLYYLVLHSEKEGKEIFRENSEQFVVWNKVSLKGIPFGATPAYQIGKEFDKATDGNLDTYYDYKNPSGGYTGIDLGEGNAQIVNFIKFSPRATFESRMTGGIFEGSNDGLNYTTLYTIPSAPAQNTEAAFNDPTAYRYLRYTGPANSYCNIAEMEFCTLPAYARKISLKGIPFGATPAYQSGREFDKATDGNLGTYYDYKNPSGGYTGIDLGEGNAQIVNFIKLSPRSTFESRMAGGIFEGSNDGLNYTTLYTIPSTPAQNTEAAVNTPTAYRYLRYTGPANSYCNIAEMEFYTVAPYPHKVSLKGIPFGATPAYQIGREFDKATDGNLDTYYDYKNSSGGYTGIDLGEGNAQIVNFIKFSPRATLGLRMIGGIFEGSNDGLNYTTLYTIPSAPAQNTEVAVNDPTAYRYLRYTGPANSYCNIAEMEFYTMAAYSPSVRISDLLPSGNSTDSNHEDVSNLVEYALGTSPSLAGSSPVSVERIGNKLQLNFTKNSGATDVTVHAYCSSDLINWSSAGITEHLISDDGTIQNWQAEIPIDSIPRLFFRLQITRSTQL